MGQSARPHLDVRSLYALERVNLRGPSDLVCIRAPGTRPALPADGANVRRRLDLEMHEVDWADPEHCRRFVPPSREQARAILDFAASCQTPYLVLQCDNGVGRSQAAAAALVKAWGDLKSLHALKEHGTYNPVLYRLMTEEAGCPDPPPKKVSMVVSVFWPLQKFYAFMLSMLAQRYENWEVIAVTDGPDPDLEEMDAEGCDFRPFFEMGVLRTVQTEEHKGNWCHHYRQLGIDAAGGDYIGMSNDDNYYVPGYLEQMVYAIEHHNADLAMCHMAHSYHGWCEVAPHPVEGSNDLGCWVARAPLVRDVPWVGTEAVSDGAYCKQLIARARGVAVVPRVLFVKN